VKTGFIRITHSLGKEITGRTSVKTIKIMELWLAGAHRTSGRYFLIAKRLNFSAIGLNLTLRKNFESPKKINAFLPQDDPTSNQVFMESGLKAITSGFVSIIFLQLII
jgi:hypothetical protein